MNIFSLACNQRQKRAFCQSAPGVRQFQTLSWIHHGSFTGVFILFAACFLLYDFLLLPKNLRAEILEGKKISQLKIIGAAQVPEKKILNILNLKGSLFSKKFFRNEMEKALLNLRAYYFSQGFINYSAAPEVSLSEENNGVNIALFIFEGNPYIVRSVHIEIEVSSNEKEALLGNSILKTFAFKPGKAFDPAQIEEHEKIINKILSDEGYRLARVTPKIKKTGHNVDLTYHIITGSIWYVQRISFEGTKSIQDFVVQNELEMRAGAIYSASLIQETIDSLYATGLFRSISLQEREIQGTTDISQRKEVELHLKLEESEHRSIGFGFGYDNTESWKGIIRWQTTNALQRGALLRSDISHSKIKTEFKETYKEKNFLIKKLIIESKPFWRRKNVDLANQYHYSQKTLGVENDLIYPLGKFLRVSLGYDYLYNYDIKTEDEQFYANPEWEGLKISNEQILKQGLSLSSKDDFLNPSKGIHTYILTKTHWKIENPQFNFLQLNYTLAFYAPLFWGFVFAPSGGVGFMYLLNKGGQVHPLDRFIQGEDFNLRGFPYGQFGPKDENGHFVGGDRFYFWILELRSPYIYFFQIVIFGDWGNLYLNSWKSEKPELTPGIGLRIRTPVGPLRLDVGFNGQSREWLKNPNFSFGLGQFF